MAFPKRVKVEISTLEWVMGLIEKSLKEKLKDKGDLSFCSTHEGLGAITEEYHELIEAVRQNDWSNIKHELLDVIISSLFTYASLEQYSIEIDKHNI